MAVMAVMASRFSFTNFTNSSSFVVFGSPEQVLGGGRLEFSLLLMALPFI